MQIRNRIKELRQVKASELLPNPRNWRRHPAGQADALRGALAEIGYADALIAYETPDGLMLIDGHLRAETTPDMEVPVLVTDLDEDEANKLLMTLDPLAAMASADTATFDALRQMTTVDSDALKDMLDAITGGNLKSLEAMQKPKVGLTDPDEVPPEAEEAWVQVGDLFQLGEHRVMCGDAGDSAHFIFLMNGRRAELLITSPPYNQNIDQFRASGMQKESPNFVKRMASAYQDTMDEAEYQDWQIYLLNMWPDFLAENGSMFYNHKIRYRDKSIIAPMEWLQQIQYKVRQEIIWNRSSSITMNARMFIPCDERIYWIRIGDDFIFNDVTEIKAWTSVWTIAARNAIAVSAPFPIEIPMRCIRAVSNNNSIIIDPFLGSGTTLIACEKLDRICYGMEIEPRYVQVAIERWQNYTGQKAVKL